ncbi:MAG: winged helix-turn-helix transcriptional regulator [Lachnospiraceae bacterium]|nr:winged helix-turn-helix transcriptional regulator [Lachnospiraceae bacterium]
MEGTSSFIHSSNPASRSKSTFEVSEECGMLHREVIPDKPPRTLYSLTPFERSVIPVLDAMCDRGAGFLDGLDIQPPCCTKKSAGEP